MPYCIKAEDGSYEYVFTKEDIARMGIGPELLQKLNEVRDDD